MLGKERRLRTVLRGCRRRGLVVAIDHGLFMGPVAGATVLPQTVGHVLAGTPDALQLAAGSIARLGGDLASTDTALVYRLDMTNVWRANPLGASPGYWSPAGSPLQAIQLGASAAVAFLLGGWRDDAMERENVRQLSIWARECHDLGLPFMIEPLPLSGKLESANDAALVRMLARVAAELGCDLLKLDYDGNADAFHELIQDVAVPVLARGGPRAADRAAYLRAMSEALDAGASGLVVGRNAFEGQDPAGGVRELMRLVHGDDREAERA